MTIRKAARGDLSTVRKIVADTISMVYPHYYPNGAVDFFLSHHSVENIARDIENGCVYLCSAGDEDIGTVTVCKNELMRLFVTAEHQGKGYGRELLDFAESLIAQDYDDIIIDASFPAKRIYLKRGYRETDYNIIHTENGDNLCYDVMKKKVR